MRRKPNGGAMLTLAVLAFMGGCGAESGELLDPGQQTRQWLDGPERAAVLAAIEADDTLVAALAERLTAPVVAALAEDPAVRGAPGADCVVTQTAEGAEIQCGASQVTLNHGRDGADCTVEATASGARIVCGESVVDVADGQAGVPCWAAVGGDGPEDCVPDLSDWVTQEQLAAGLAAAQDEAVAEAVGAAALTAVQLAETQTITVGADGDFGSLTAALGALAGRHIPPGNTVTVSILEDLSVTGPLLVDHPDGRRLRLVGAPGTPATLSFSGPGLVVGAHGLGGLEHLLLAGQSTALAIEEPGITVRPGGSLEAVDVQVSGFQTGVLVEAGARLSAPGLVVSDSLADGVVVRNGAFATIDAAVVSASGNHGLVADNGAFVVAELITIDGAGGAGLLANVGSALRCSGATVHQASTALLAYNGSAVEATDLITSDIDVGVRARLGSSVLASSGSWPAADKAASVVSGSVVDLHGSDLSGAAVCAEAAEVSYLDMSDSTYAVCATPAAQSTGAWVDSSGILSAE